MPSYTIQSKAEFLDLLYNNEIDIILDEDNYPEDYLENLYHGMRPIHIAVALENVGLINALIKCGVDVNATDSIGNTPLHYCAARCDRNLTNILINAGANVSAKNNEELEPIHIAKEGQASAKKTRRYVDLLEEHGAVNTAGKHFVYHERGGERSIDLTSCLTSSSRLKIGDQTNYCLNAVNRNLAAQNELLIAQNQYLANALEDTLDGMSNSTPASISQFHLFYPAKTTDDVATIQEKGSKEHRSMMHISYGDDLDDEQIKRSNSSPCLLNLKG